MRTISLKDKKYEVIKDVKDAVDMEAILNLFTEYFESFDYLVGDWAYGKLRLKGFNNKTNSNFKKINDIDGVDDYIKKQCAYGCKYFILAKKE